MLYAQSATKYSIRSEGDFHKKIYSWKDKSDRNKTWRTEWESGSCRENWWNEIQLKGPRRQKQTQWQKNKKEWASSVDWRQRHKPQHPHHVKVISRGLELSRPPSPAGLWNKDKSPAIEIKKRQSNNITLRQNLFTFESHRHVEQAFREYSHRSNSQRF